MNKLANNIASLTLFLLPLFSYAEQVCDGNNETTPEDNFNTFDDVTEYVVDNTTGLAWARCLLGQTWNSDQESCDGEAVRLTWQDALKASLTYELAQQTDWRLPNIKELTSLVERKCVIPAINIDVFPNTPSDSYWTSTPNTASNKSDEAWSVAFYNGRIDSRDKMQDFYVRMVRYAE